MKTGLAAGQALKPFTGSAPWSFLGRAATARAHMPVVWLRIGLTIPIVRSMIVGGCNVLRRLNGGIASGLQQQMKNLCLVVRQQ